MIVEDINGFPQNSNSSFSHSSTSDTDQPARFAATGLGWFWRIFVSFSLKLKDVLVSKRHNLNPLSWYSAEENVRSLVTGHDVRSLVLNLRFLPF